MSQEPASASPTKNSPRALPQCQLCTVSNFEKGNSDGREAAPCLPDHGRGLAVTLPRPRGDRAQDWPGRDSEPSAQSWKMQLASPPPQPRQDRVFKTIVNRKNCENMTQLSQNCLTPPKDTRIQLVHSVSLMGYKRLGKPKSSNKRFFKD